MDEFARTRDGQTFLHKTLPELTEALNRLAKAVEENNRLRSETVRVVPVPKLVNPDAVLLKKEDYDFLKESVENQETKLVNVIKALRQVTGWSLKISKDFIERYFSFLNGGIVGNVKGFMANFTFEGQE
jgi:ribosomal protein L7/L12